MSLPSRSLRYAVWPLISRPLPGITFTVVMPPACAFWIPSSRASMASRMRTEGCMGLLRSPPSPPPMCECVSTRPGMMVLPVASWSTAPAGMAVSGPPTAVMRPPCTTSTPFCDRRAGDGEEGGAPERVRLLLRPGGQDGGRRGQERRGQGTSHGWRLSDCGAEVREATPRACGEGLRGRRTAAISCGEANIRMSDRGG